MRVMSHVGAASYRERGPENSPEMCICLDATNDGRALHDPSRPSSRASLLFDALRVVGVRSCGIVSLWDCAVLIVLIV